MHVIRRRGSEVYPVAPRPSNETLLRIVGLPASVSIPAGSAAFNVSSLNLTALGAGAPIIVAGALPVTVGTQDPPGVGLLTLLLNLTLDGANLTPLCAASFGIKNATTNELVAGQYSVYRRIFIPGGAHTLALTATTNADSLGVFGPGELYILGNPAHITF